MITCRDHMLTSIATNVKTVFAGHLRGASKTHLEQAEQAATAIAEANMELACAFIQKAAMEKALPEIEKRLHDVSKRANSTIHFNLDLTILTRRFP